MTMFKDAGQAVHFAFVMEQYTVSMGGSMHYFDEVRKARNGNEINLADLTPTEIRAQCSSVRDLVRTKLPMLEESALVARFSHNQRIQTAAIINVADHFAPQLRDKGDAVLIRRVIARHYIPEDVRGAAWTVRSLAYWHRVSKDRVQRLAKLAGQLIEQLEAQALDLLDAEFEQRGITRIKEAA